MRIAFTPAARARREATKALVRHRVDTLFGPQGPVPVPGAATASGLALSPARSPAMGPALSPSLSRSLSAPRGPGRGPGAGLASVAALAAPPPVPAPPSLPTPLPGPPLPGPPLPGPPGGPAALAATAALPLGAPDPPPARPPLASSLALALKERWDLDRKALIGLAVLLVLALGYGIQHFWSGRPEPVAVPAPAVEGTAAVGAASPSPGASPGAPPGAAGGPAPGSTAIAGLVVDVSGKVRNPGLRTLPPGSRVQDALNAAGGPLPGTDLTGLNLARKVSDGEEIIVAATPPPAPGGAARSSVPLSLSTATEAQLDALPGVGPVLAQRIVQFRQQHGGFQSVDQLRQVPGFGERRLQDLRAQLRP